MKQNYDYIFVKIVAYLNIHKYSSFSSIQQHLKLEAKTLLQHLSIIEELFPLQIKLSVDSVQLLEPIALFTDDDFDEFNQFHHLKVKVVDTCLSTNSYLVNQLKDHAKSPNMQVVVANEQLNGRGRQEHHWQSDLGSSLTFSLIWTLKATQNIQVIPLIIAVAVSRALREFDIHNKIKWPNDIMINNAKLGGILVEGLKYNNNHLMVIGVGLNYKPLNIKNIQLSSVIENNPEVMPIHLIYQLLDNIEKALLTFSQTGFSSFQFEFNQWHLNQGKRVRLTFNNNVIIEGIIQTISEDGALIILDDHFFLKRITTSDFSLQVLN